MVSMRRLIPLLLASTLTGYPAVAEELTVLNGDATEVLPDYLNRQCKILFDKRRAAVEEALGSVEGVLARQAKLRQAFRQMLGTLPQEKCPLNAQVTGTIRGEGYVIEKVVYESRPRHHVTANLYIPTSNKRPMPGVLVPCGHSRNGKAYAAYQSICVLLATHGFVALCYDPIGQGEREQFLPRPGSPTATHVLLDNGGRLVGTHTATYRVWDGIRSLDYLASRPEVDATRIGCTGNSGGGRMTALLGVADKRIGPTAPGCNVTTVEAHFAAIGPADAENHLPGEGAFGFEHADLLTARAPKPTLLLTATRDSKPILGSWESFREAKRNYAALGASERVDLIEYNDGHGYSKPRRERAVEWMCRWLQHDDRDVQEPELRLQTTKDLQVTKTGQVLTASDELTVADLNLQRARQLAPVRARFWKELPKEHCLDEVRRLIGCRPQRAKPAVQKQGGPLSREGYRIEKLVINRPEEVPVPALLFRPAHASGKLPATLYVHGRGKAADAGPQGQIAKLVKQGQVVLAIDVRGCGETTDSWQIAALKRPKYPGAQFRTTMMSMHLGRCLLGQRVEDVLAALDVLASHNAVDAERIRLIAIERAGPVALHAAALDKRVAELVLRQSIDSWIDDVVAKPLDANAISHVVPFALEKYDLPDLVKALAARKCRIERS